MRILVTNDDGIDSIGLHVLARAVCGLEGGHEVVVIAPDRSTPVRAQRSARCT